MESIDKLIAIFVVIGMFFFTGLLYTIKHADDLKQICKLTAMEAKYPAAEISVICGSK